MLSTLLHLLASLFLILHLVYWCCCLLLGPPLSQPNLSDQLSELKIFLWGKVWGRMPLGRFEGQYPTWKARLFFSRPIITHLLLGRPFFGIFLLADEALFKPAYSRQRIVRPLYVISAGRSGSTTLGQLLDADPTLTGPPFYFGLFPSLSFWMAIQATAGRFISPESVSTAVIRTLKRVGMEEFLVRHELEVFKPDTFDLSVDAARGWSKMRQLQNPFAAHTETRCSWEAIGQQERNASLDYHDEVARKWLWWSGADDAGQHLLMKSHLLEMLPGLKERHPDGTFVGVAREPEDLIRSGIPFLSPMQTRCKPALGDWPAAVRGFATFVKEYTDLELKFSSGKSPQMLILPFKTLITDAAAAMQTVYYWRGSQSGCEMPMYCGSAHEANVKRVAEDPERKAHAAWRKLKKKQYPVMTREVLVQRLDEAVQEYNLPVFDMDLEFAAYRQLVANGNFAGKTCSAK